MKLFQMIALGSALAMVPAMAQVPSASTAKSTATDAATKTAKAAATPAPTAAEIADAKTKGLVWVNLNTKKYHQSAASTYGTTKHGKFMTEDDAKKGGYVAAQEPSAGKKAKAAAAPASKQ
jgi:hypothetical protein